jgi:hypothetical protein
METDESIHFDYLTSEEMAFVVVITEILLKVTLNTITLTHNPCN